MRKVLFLKKNQSFTSVCVQQCFGVEANFLQCVGVLLQTLHCCLRCIRLHCSSGIVSLGLDNREKPTPLQKYLDFEKKISRSCICLHCSSGIVSLGWRVDQTTEGGAVFASKKLRCCRDKFFFSKRKLTYTLV